MSAAEFFTLAADLRGAGAKMVGPLGAAFDTAGKATAQAWKGIATATSGEHGKHYPNSITHEMRFTFGGNVEVEIGPDSGMPQGSMGRGFEFGSRNQPPHLDGVKAFEQNQAGVEKAADAAIRPVIP